MQRPYCSRLVFEFPKQMLRCRLVCEPGKKNEGARFHAALETEKETNV